MHRISPNNPVRRALLFEENVEEQAKVDNFANILQETTLRDREEKSKKWNFDFINEVPLEGPYEWFRKDGDEWVGMKPKKREGKISSDEENFYDAKFQNENTPVHVRDGSISIIRKRKTNIENKTTGQLVKRKVDFDHCSFLRRS